MPYPDWPLTIFTLTTQLVLGAFVVLWITDLLARQLAEPREQEQLTSVGVWLLGPLMAIGLLVSLLHLGHPIFAFRALRHVESSWLSREVISVSAFFGLGAGYAYLWWRHRNLFALRAAYGAFLLMVGGLALASMTALYLVPARPTWYLVSTPLEFVATALLLGPLLVGAVFLTLTRLRPNAESNWLLRFHLRAMAYTTLAGAALVGIAMASKWWLLSGPGAEGQAALILLNGPYRPWIVLRLILFVAGAIGLPLLLLRRLPEPSSLALSTGTSIPVVKVNLVSYVWAMLAMVVVSEILGRALFYATAIPIRPPGAFF
jgi:anaerobic dimethyl sulfoxide reductase subunit C